MKLIFATVLALTLGSTALTSIAQADEVQIPAQVTESETLADYMNQLVAVQATELVWLDAQTKYYEIMRASFEGSHAMSNLFNKKLAQTATSIGTGTVTIVADAFLARAWLAGATPSAMILKDIWNASRGDVSKLTSVGQKTWASLTTLAKTLKVPKNFVTTAALGTFVYIQVENYFVINMSEAQYQAVIASLDSKIATLIARKAAVSDTHIPYSVR